MARASSTSSMAWRSSPPTASSVGRRITAQGEEVLHAGPAEGHQDLGQLQAGVLDTDEMGHGGERRRPQHARHQVVRPLARLAPAPVGHRDERRAGAARAPAGSAPASPARCRSWAGRTRRSTSGPWPACPRSTPWAAQPTGGSSPTPRALPPARRPGRCCAAAWPGSSVPPPPIRGVIQPATSPTASSTSDSSVRPRHEVPAPTTAAPDFTMSGVTNPADPAAATTTSPVRTRPARSATPVWTTVTAALQWGRLSDRSRARGRPMVSPRPITTTWRPSTGTS